MPSLSLVTHSRDSDARCDKGRENNNYHAYAGTGVYGLLPGPPMPPARVTLNDPSMTTNHHYQ